MLSGFDSNLQPWEATLWIISRGAQGHGSSRLHSLPQGPQPLPLSCSTSLTEVTDFAQPPRGGEHLPRREKESDLTLPLSTLYKHRVAPVPRNEAKRQEDLIFKRRQQSKGTLSLARTWHFPAIAQHAPWADHAHPNSWGALSRLLKLLPTNSQPSARTRKRDTARMIHTRRLGKGRHLKCVQENRVYEHRRGKERTSLLI